MKLKTARIRGFRRLEDVDIDFEESQTLFVGPNNSGKTSVVEAIRLFLRSGDFSIHDFSVPSVSQLDAFGYDNLHGDDLPSIELDLWFSIDPEYEFGRIGRLLPDADQDYEQVGIGIRLIVNDAEDLKECYTARFPRLQGEPPRKSLTHYLSLPSMLKKHFDMVYCVLGPDDDIAGIHQLTPDDGKALLRSIVRVEFVDAQRRIADGEQPGSTQLSRIMTAYYKRNLTQAQTPDSANAFFDKHNDELTKHYQSEFTDLLGVIKGLGVPSVNDRTLRIISSLVPETVLKNNTTLIYRDDGRGHELPERYNGLGIKNLIYLAVQICEHHINWIKAEESRPLSLIVFIEEPEVHLHAQAQQTFVKNAWEIIKNASQACGEEAMTPQLVLTTHSSHILDTIDFANVRYFRREKSEADEPSDNAILNATKVLSLRSFSPIDLSNESEAESRDEEPGDTTDGVDATPIARPTEALKFLKHYMRLTHCDLFFADATILVEGPVEKLLFPEMIKKTAPGLLQRYVTVLEIGGAYAHRFAELIEFLKVPYLVVADIDSVDPKNNRATCRADTEGAVSSNAAITFFLNEASISALKELNAEQQVLKERRSYVAFQKPSKVQIDGKEETMHGRTFEETFAIENIELLREGKLTLGAPMPSPPDFQMEYEFIFKTVNASKFKKMELALAIVASTAQWSTPDYIAKGLTWLSSELKAHETSSQPEPTE